MKPSFREQWVEHNGVGFTVREITTDDLSEYVRIVDTQQPVMEKGRMIDLEDFRHGFEKFNTDRKVNVGAFDADNKLRSCYGMFFWSSMPYVTDSTLVVDRSYSHMFNPQKSGLIHIMRSLYAYCEDNGYFHHYSVRYAKHLELEYKMWDKYTSEFSERYERYDDFFVPANTRPEWIAYWRVMGEHTLPYDTVIKYTRLKGEYRNVSVC